MNYLRIYHYLIRQQLKALWQYRVDFCIGAISILFGQLVGLLIIGIVFNYVDNMYGWTQYEVALMYAFALLCRGIAHIFYDNLWILGDYYIRRGELLRVLIRPINPLIHLLADRIQLDGIGTFLSGIILTTFALSQLGVDLSFILIVKIVYYAVVGSLVYFGVYLLTATLSFWMVDSVPVTYIANSLSDLTRYPLNIMPVTLQRIFTFVVPFAFTGYFPVTDILGKSQPFLQTSIWLTMMVVVLVLMVVAYAFWLYGLRHYNGTGS